MFYIQLLDPDFFSIYIITIMRSVAVAASSVYRINATAAASLLDFILSL